ncbi:class I SAM-dependent methyltransferase [Zhongshania arctica]|uniref:Class I SAM-dependent methyltransferase n=1 Tax=Zhongshania arctica TaxID=3238302 RepID=A0ABV3TRE7_9GAMM
MPPHSDSRDKWNNRHSSQELSLAACEVLQKHIHLLAKRGTALDLACGLGRNAIQLAQHGLQCDAIDISDVAIDRLQKYANHNNLNINAERADIERDGIGSKKYDVIVVSYFLFRPLLPAIVRALKPGGLLFYQTFVRPITSENGVILKSPANASFYLEKNELCAQFKQLEIRYYQETILDRNTSTAPVAMLVARMPSGDNPKQIS